MQTLLNKIIYIEKQNWLYLVISKVQSESI